MKSKKCSVLLMLTMVLVLAMPSAVYADVRGVVKEAREKAMLPVSDAVVMIGQNLWIMKQGGTDLIMGKVLAEGTTDTIGNFDIKLERKGVYSMIVWKKGFAAAMVNGVTNPGVMPSAVLYPAADGEALAYKKNL